VEGPTPAGEQVMGKLWRNQTGVASPRMLARSV
jgi:hypothetical protein